jgi:hypothetical protein
MPQLPVPQPLDHDLQAQALQEAFFIQPTVVVGLLAHVTGLTLQEDIAITARRLQQLGRDILSGSPPHTGGIPDAHPPPISLPKLRRVPSQCSWVDQRLVREHVIEHLSHEACALSLFVVTVADAQGLSLYADRSLGQRLSMSPPGLHQGRQALITAYSARKLPAIPPQSCH